MDSPFKDRLYTNSVPSDADCQAIRTLLVGPRKAAADLMEEITRVHAMLEKLTQKYDQLNEFIDAHLALVSPVRRLPDDVVQEIFAASLPSNQNTTMSGAESPLLLCHICRAWRTIALATPRLWTSLHIVAPSNSRLPQFTDAVTEWLSRSGSLPIAFSLVISHSAMVHAQYIWILLSALIHLSRRWKRVRFELPAHGIFLQPLATLSESDVPILQSASIDFPIAPTDDPNWTSVGFIATPSLRSVSMVCYMWHPVPELPIRYKNLRHLKINCIASSALQSIVQMLRKCPVLETCVLYAKDSRHSRYPAQISTPFRMEHLSRLRVTDPRCTTETLFQHLVLPQLRILEFICSRTTLLTRPLPFASIFSSADRLECLHITQGSGALSTSSLVEVLALAPMLQELHMIGEPSMEGTPNPADNPVDLITMLTPGAVGAAIILCPELQRVKLERFRDVTDSTLLEFIQARTGPHPQDVAHLSSVDVWFDREQQADIFPPLQNVIATGLKLSVVYDPPTRPLYSPFEALVQEDPGWETW